MPNIITHKLFADRVEQRLDKRDIAAWIQQEQQIYNIGSNGPDFLFFSHLKPWEAYKSHALNHLGSAIHADHINAFYQLAIERIREQKHAEIKRRMSVYLFGHLCHWALDKTTHPYIFYRTGNGRGVSASMHHRFESMLDTILLQRLSQNSIKDFKSYTLCIFDDAMLQAIARIYIPAAKQIYHQEVNVHELREALNSWHDIQKLLYDPKHIKFNIIQGIERLIRNPWVISGNIVKAEIDEQYDIMNDEKRIWKHPCDDTITCDASFMELFDEGVDLALKIVTQAYGCIEYGADIQKLLLLLQNQAYDTGMDTKQEMRYFDVIYKEA